MTVGTFYGTTVARFVRIVVHTLITASCAVISLSCVWYLNLRVLWF